MAFCNDTVALLMFSQFLSYYSSPENANEKARAFEVYTGKIEIIMKNQK